MSFSFSSLEQKRRLIREKTPPVWLTGLLVGGTFIWLVSLELRRPLRRSVESKLKRDIRNLAVAGISAGMLQILERPVTGPLSRWVEKHHIGLLKMRPLSPKLEIGLAIGLLDYTLYLWHVLAHKAPFLWRFHQVHHVDLDMDASTALRFHFGELAISVLWRAVQICLIGVSPRALAIWQTALLLEIMFHHSNVKLPLPLEKWLGRIVVTPRMHAIHHSVQESETNSNWSSGLTIWDWLHGTLKVRETDCPVTIGVPAYSNADEMTLRKILQMPFSKQKPSWPDRKPDGPPDGEG
jgi:sterol desaturase/sphingolipid hydroxylase (fatty acid hydroxylase superfamily)